MFWFADLKEQLGKKQEKRTPSLFSSSLDGKTSSQQKQAAAVVSIQAGGNKEAAERRSDNLSASERGPPDGAAPRGPLGEPITGQASGVRSPNLTAVAPLRKLRKQSEAPPTGSVKGSGRPRVAPVERA